MKHLWSKSDESATSTDRVQQFMSGEDIQLDRELMEYDICGTAVHAAGLQRIGLLTPEELSAIQRSLDELTTAFRSGEYKLEAPMEDSHTAIELWLTEHLGELGEKVHAGRSRNDQVLLATRMYVRDRLQNLADVCLDLANAFLTRAQQDEFTPMPGYTHLQRAVPSSVGLWMGGFAESFLDIAELARSIRDWVNSCPLGTAAGYGVNLSLDRQFVADELGFQRLQLNPMYAQNSRGRFEWQALSVLAQATMEMRRFSWDMSLFATQEFDFVAIDAQFITGSSIMPNKANPDFVELARAQHAVVQASMVELESIVSLPSGYHRDLQLTKPPVIRAFQSSLPPLSICVDLVKSMRFKRDNMLAAIDDSLYATDVAIDRASQRGVPFRQAYRQPATAKELAGRQPHDSLRHRTSPGGCGALGLDRIERRLRECRLAMDRQDAAGRTEANPPSS